MYVTIAVPTFRRPQLLAALIPKLVAQLNGYAGEVLVIDNDPDQSAANLDYPASVRYLSEPNPGIAAVRNRALAEAGEGLLAFIDDDETPHESWLSALVDTWLVTEAAAVAGRVIPEYLAPVSSWIEAGEFFVRRNLATGTVVPTAPTSNLLLDLAQVRALDLWFDLRFGLSGGEDTMFTTQLTATGRKIVFCAESIVTDQVPASRLSIRWVLQRAFSHGNTAGVIEILTGNRFSRLPLFFGGAGRFLAGVGRFLFGVATFSLPHRAKGARLAFRGLGLASAALGFTYIEYARR